MSKKYAKNMIIGAVTMAVIIIAMFIIIKQKADKRSMHIPFSELNWTSTYEDMVKAEGELFVTYPSTGGTTYQYIKEYLGKSGYLKYHFGDNGTLLGIAWACEAADAEELKILYDSITSDLIGSYGEGRSTASGLNEVWELADGTEIHVNSGFGGSDFSLQYFYVNPSSPY